MTETTHTTGRPRTLLSATATQPLAALAAARLGLLRRRIGAGGVAVGFQKTAVHCPVAIEHSADAKFVAPMNAARSEEGWCGVMA